MPSTSSSADPAQQTPSATESLAARYRHLFVLPRTSTLVLLTVLASLLLSLASRGADWIVPFAASSAVAVITAFLISGASKLADGKTIATFRRADAAVLASQTLWLVLTLLGLGASIVTGGTRPLANAVLFGTLLCVGLEFIIINGAFLDSVALSAALAVVHPVATFAVLGRLVPGQGVFALAAGITSTAIVAAFIIQLRRRKTSQGYDAPTLFKAFMKTWAGGDAKDLEEIIAAHAVPATVTTKVLRFQRSDGSIFVVLPGVHPGPFYPVGSYNLPGVLSAVFRPMGPVLTLHRTGGHERNLVSSAETQAYASQLGELAQSISPQHPGQVQGPLSAMVGKALAGACAFAEDLLLTISFAPLGSDDLEPRVEEELSSIAAARGYYATVVDAHNSIGRVQEHPDVGQPGWGELLDRLKGTEARPLRVAYAHSSEVAFSPGDDITETGVGLLMLEAGGTKSVLILADSNNAAPGLRQRVADTLGPAGFDLFELCTSDSHDLAAKGLTAARGYNALGEDTPADSIAKMSLDMARLAEGRLAPCKYGSGQLRSIVKVFGARALGEFAEITQSSARFAKQYWKLAALSIAALFVLSLFL